MAKKYSSSQLGNDFVKFFRDPVHNYIGVTQEELNIIELPIFQRLRWISQLSFVDLVYPDAKHSRFSHSLGTMYLAWKYAEHLLDLDIIKIKDVRLFRFAGLLHDIGHAPFSHAFEPALHAFLYPEQKTWIGIHELFGQKIILEPQYKISETLGNRSSSVANMIRGKDPNGKHSTIFETIMKAPFCCDRLDYLQRDAYHLGTMEYSIIDSERIIRSLVFDNSEPRYLRKGLYALEGALLSYYNMYRSSYYHHTTRAAFSLFTELTWQLFEENEEKKEEEGIEMHFTKPNKFLSFTNYTFTHKYHENQLLQMLVCRNLPKVIISEIDFERYKSVLGKLTTLIQNKYEKKRSIEKELLKFLNKKISNKIRFVFIDAPRFIPYAMFQEEDHFILDEFDPLQSKELSGISKIVEALKEERKKMIPRIYIYPRIYSKSSKKKIEKLKIEIVNKIKSIIKTR